MISGRSRLAHLKLAQSHVRSALTGKLGIRAMIEHAMQELPHMPKNQQRLEMSTSSLLCHLIKRCSRKSRIAFPKHP